MNLRAGKKFQSGKVGLNVNWRRKRSNLCSDWILCNKVKLDLGVLLLRVKKALLRNCFYNLCGSWVEIIDSNFFKKNNLN